MFSQSADQPAADQSPAPAGMRELPPQPTKPMMPAYTTTPEPPARAAGPGPDDSVIARDDHLEGTFTSRGTVVVMGSVKGRIEAVRVRIEDGASVDADVIVDEAIIAGEFTGNLTCRERLEAHASGRINGRIETFRLMLHEGASVEGEMHMLTELPRNASETIRGSAPLRGEGQPGSKPEPGTDARAETRPSGEAASSGGVGTPRRPVAPAPTPAPTEAPTPTPTSSPTASGPTPAADAPHQPSPGSPPTSASAGASSGASAVRSSLAETLRTETLSMRVAPRTSSASRGYGSSARDANGSRSGKSTSGF